MRVDEDDMRIGSSWKNPAIGRMEWLMIITLGVMLGGLLHDGARLLIANAWANHQLEQFQKEMGKANRQMQERQIAQESANQRARIEAERVRKQNSAECKFWMQQNQQNPSQKAESHIWTHCQ